MMNYIIMVNQLYFVTYKQMGKALPVADDYAPIIHHLNTKGHVIYETYETDKKGRLHWHGLWESRKNFYFKTIRWGGFSLKVKEVYDVDKLMSYMRKQNANEHETNMLVASVYARQNYMF